MRSNQMARRNLTDAWKLELQFGNKEDLLEEGRERRDATQGRPAADKLLSKNDNSLSGDGVPDDAMGAAKPAKHNTRDIIAQTAGVSTGKVAQANARHSAVPSS